MFPLSKILRRAQAQFSPLKPSTTTTTAASSAATTRRGYVDVKMEWKKDPTYDSIDVVNKSKLLKSLISLKNIIADAPDRCIPVSDVSKLKYRLETPTKVTKFLRQFPSFFEEFTGPSYNLPWFRLTPEAALLDAEERTIYRHCRPDLISRLRRLLLMSKDKALPLTTIQGLQWYLGLPQDFLLDPPPDFFQTFKFADLGHGEQGLRAMIGPHDGTKLSILQRNAIKNGAGLAGPVEFPMFPSKGLRLKHKIERWLVEFQKLPYISPYEESLHLQRDTDVAEKRVVGVLHELLCLFVDHAAERRRLLCLRKPLGLPQKFGEAFVRHPHIFYLSLMGKTCTVILKEAHANRDSCIEEHPLRRVRNKYTDLMNRSKKILIDQRRARERKSECSDGEISPFPG